MLTPSFLKLERNSPPAHRQARASRGATGRDIDTARPINAAPTPAPMSQGLMPERGAAPVVAVRAAAAEAVKGAGAPAAKGWGSMRGVACAGVARSGSSLSDGLMPMGLAASEDLGLSDLVVSM